MSFHAEHYIKVAKVIRELDQQKQIYLGTMISAFAEMFAEDNPKFNTGTFWDACQPEENKDGL